MTGARVVVEPDPETRAVGEGEAAVGAIDHRGRVDQLAHPRIGEVVEVLDDVDVPGRDREMDVGGRRDRPTDVVRRERQVVRLGPAGEPAHPGEPAEMGQIGLDDVDVAPSTKAVASQIEWIRSPVAIEMFVARRTRPRAAAFSGGTGSSIQRGANGSSATATWAAVSGEKRPCISIIRSMSGPIASRTAATTAIARRRSPGESRTLEAPKGSSFIAR